MTVTRFAPSPTGHLHLGHAFAALTVDRFAKAHRGRFLLRIEDIDFNRCHPDHTQQIYEDLEWLGLSWEKPVRIQSQHLDDYAAAAAKLEKRSLIYPCFCTRSDILREIENAGRAPHGPITTIYPGTCRTLSADERASRMAQGEDHSFRLDLNRALAEISTPLTWTDSYRGPQAVDPQAIGDTIIVRKDIGTSYHLAVAVDDEIQGITDIVRGEDLLESTPVHLILQRLLGFRTPHYHHHPLLTDSDGKRLAKRDRSITLKSMRERGMTADKVIQLAFPA